MLANRKVKTRLSLESLERRVVLTGLSLTPAPLSENPGHLAPIIQLTDTKSDISDVYHFAGFDTNTDSNTVGQTDGTNALDADGSPDDSLFHSAAILSVVESMATGDASTEKVESPPQETNEDPLDSGWPARHDTSIATLLLVAHY